VPVTTTIAALEDRSERRKYGWVSPDLARVLARVEAQGGTEWMARYLRLVTLVLIVRTSTQPPALVLPPSIDARRLLEFERILDEGATRPLPTDIHDDRFRKDLELCRGGLVPTGHTVLESWPRLPEDVADACARNDPPFDAVVRASSAPWLEGHLFQPRMDEFTPDGIAATSQRTVDLLEANPEYAGIFGVSLYYDPAVSAISPRLEGVRQIAEHRSVELVRIGPDPAAVAEAIATSKTRRKLYEQGLYEPTNYAVITRRENVVREEIDSTVRDAFDDKPLAPDAT